MAKKAEVLCLTCKKMGKDHKERKMPQRQRATHLIAHRGTQIDLVHISVCPCWNLFSQKSSKKHYHRRKFDSLDPTGQTCNHTTHCYYCSMLSEILNLKNMIMKYDTLIHINHSNSYSWLNSFSRSVLLYLFALAQYNLISPVLIVRLYGEWPPPSVIS